MKSLTIIVPCHNDAENLQCIMEALNTFEKLKGISLSEVMFIDDASTDTTLFLLKRAQKTVLKRFQKHFPKTKISIISYTQTRGKGFATTLGMRTSTADYTISVDPATSSLAHLHTFVPLMKKNTPAILGVYVATKRTQKDILPLLSLRLTHYAEKILAVKTPKDVGKLNMFSKKAKTLFSKTTTTRTLSLTELSYWAEKQKISFQKLKFNEKNSPTFTLENTLYDLYELGVLFWYYRLKPLMVEEYAVFQKTIFYKNYGSRILPRLR